MSAIVDIRGHAISLQENVKGFVAKHGIEQYYYPSTASKPDVGISFSDAVAIVVARFDDAINAQLKWAKTSRLFEKEVERVFTWFDFSDGPNQEKDGADIHLPSVSDDFISEVLDQIEISVIEVVNELIPDRTWLTWSTRRVGHDLVLVCGEDYRILDWQRRMNNGTWSWND